MVGAALADGLRATSAGTAVAIRAEEHARAAGGIVAVACQEKVVGCAALTWLSQAESIHEFQCLHALPQVLQDLIPAARPQDAAAQCQDCSLIHRWLLLIVVCQAW